MYEWGPNNIRIFKKILDDQNLKNKTKQTKKNLSVLIPESCVKSIR